MFEYVLGLLFNHKVEPEVTRKKKVTKSIEGMIIRFHHAGLSNKDIGETLSLHPSTISRYIKKSKA